MPPSIRYATRPVKVRFLSRPNRFLARVRPLRGGPVFEAHVPNPGRMEELLVPEETVGFVVPASGPGRRTGFDLVSVRHGRELVSIDSRVGNRLVGRALAAGELREFGRGPWTPEVRWRDQRLDFGVLPNGRRAPPTALLEVKCSNLRVEDAALFPDAPTDRGRRHVDALRNASRRGIRSGILFLVQRSDVRRFRANDQLDPEFARALDRARRRGVRVRAVSARIRPDRVEWGRWLPVE